MKFPFIVLTLLLAGCVPVQPPPPPRTQLQIREFQTRTYQDRDMKAVMKAVINALMDDGYLIKNADRELGFIHASRETDANNPSERFVAQLFDGEFARYATNSIVEVSVNISEFGPESRVRTVFQLKIIDNFGSPRRTENIADPNFYQEFFSKVDKSLYFERQRL